MTPDRAIPALPTGTVTFLFTDIEGSTRLWERHREAMQRALARHDQLLASLVSSCRGRVFKTVGDAVCAAFATPRDALEAAVAAQRALEAERWEAPGGIRVRMALHTGTAEERDGDYFGPPLNRVARLLGIGYGGQVLLSRAAAELLRDALPDGIELSELGEHRLKDLARPEVVFQAVGAGLRREFPPLKSLGAQPTNLPLQPTPFIARERELREVEQLLASDGVRALSLTGVGGAGKTRLALQAAADLLERFEDGAWFVDLSAIDAPAHVPLAIARTLGLRGRPGVQPMETLRDSLRGSRMLLVLDNLEQVVGGAAPLVAELLSSCPSIKVLATSREALHLRGEHLYPVGSLATPPARRGRPEPQALERLRQYDSVVLFIERATAARPDFAVTSANAPAVAEICVRLDGLPLAIELAAARIALLSPEALLARLDHQLRVLGGGPADLPARQRTLRATIDWSFHLLGPAEQTLLREVAVFAGGATVAAVEGVCACVGQVDVLETLSSLAAKSLLAQQAREGEPRFRMLESIREYARELAAPAGATEGARDAHAGWFLAMAERTEPTLTGPEQKRGFDSLDADSDNLDAALEWLDARGRAADALAMAAALGLFWRVRGYAAEGTEHLERVLAAAEASPGSVGPGLRARALRALGDLLQEQGRYDDSARRLTESREIARPLGDRAAEQRALASLGWTWYRMNRRAEATRCFSEVAASPADGPLEGSALLGLGVLALRDGKPDDAIGLFDRVRSSAVGRGDVRQRAQAIANLAMAHGLQGDHARAIARCREAVLACEELGDTSGAMVACNNLGFLSLETGDSVAARAWYGKLAALARRVVSLRFGCLAHAGLADVAVALGERAGAIEEARAGVAMAERLAGSLESGVCLRALGEAERLAGNREEALSALGRSISFLEECGEEQELARAREELRLVNEGAEAGDIPGKE